MSISLSTVTKLVSLGTVYVVLVSYGICTAYYAGYLARFGVDIRMVNFWPSLYDFMTKSAAGLAALLLVIGVYLAVFASFVLLGRIEQKIGRAFGWERLEHASDGPLTSLKFIVGSTVVATVVLSGGIVSYWSYSLGASDAEQQTSFTRIITSPQDQTRQLLIYQSGGIGIVKTYNMETQKLSAGYSIIDLTGKSFVHFDVAASS